MNCLTRLIAFLIVAAPVTSAVAQNASAYRRFTGKDGRSFYAAIVSKTDASVTFRLQNGAPAMKPIRDLSDPDAQFIRHWTKFKDALMNDAQFAKLTVREMLELRGYQSFEFDIIGNHIFVEGELNGKPAKFVVDTGAQTSLLHLASAKEAGIEVGPMDQTIYGIGGKTMAGVAQVKSLKLGDAAIENRKILAADIFANSGGSNGYDAIFGADFLRELDTVISYREGRMFLKPDNVKKAEAAASKAAPSAYGEFRRWTTTDGKSFVAALADKNEKEAFFRLQDGRIAAPLPVERLDEANRDIVAKWDKLRESLARNPEWRTLTVKELLELRGYQSFEYRLSGNHILVDGDVGTTKATFLIDTGAHGGVFNLEFSQRAKLNIGPMDQEIRGIAGSAPAATTKVPLLKLGEVLVKDREVLSADLNKDLPVVGGRGTHDAIFGADFLRELDAVISYKEGRMFLRPDASDKEEAAKADGAEKPAAGDKAGAAAPK
jgi:predicted aspartyl protease